MDKLNLTEMLQTLLGTEFESVGAYSCDSTSKSSSTGKEHVPNTCLRRKVGRVPPVLPLERGAWPAKPSSIVRLLLLRCTQGPLQTLGQ